MFNASFAADHIAKWHAKASDQDLLRLRDARRVFMDYVSESNGKSVKTKKDKNYLMKIVYKSSGAPPVSGGLPSLGKKR